VAGATLTLSGAPTSVPGKFGTALQLGQSRYIRSTKRPFANVGTKDFTVEFWVRIADLGVIGDHDVVNLDFYPIQIGLDNTWHMHFEHYGYGWNTVVSGPQFTAAMGSWAHFAVSRVSGTTRMFFNGKKVAESTRLNNVNINQTGDMIIGARNNGINRSASSIYEMDEVRMIDGVGLYVNDFIPPTEPFSDSSISFDGWTVAWKATSDAYNQISNWAYDIPLTEVQKATKAAIAYYDSTAGSFTPVSMFSFDIPPEWKTQHPFNYPANDYPLVAYDHATGQSTSGSVLRYGNQSFATQLADPWSGPGSNWGRIGITNSKAPFFNGFAANGTDYASTSDLSYGVAYAAPAKRFVILVK